MSLHHIDTRHGVDQQPTSPLFKRVLDDMRSSNVPALHYNSVI